MTLVCSSTSHWRGCVYPAEGLCFFKMGIGEDNAWRIVHMLRAIAAQCEDLGSIEVYYCRGSHSAADGLHCFLVEQDIRL